MKKVLITLTIVSLLAVGVAAYAHGTGWRGGGHMWGFGSGCYETNPGYGCYGAGPGYGGHMYGWTRGDDQKFFDETASIRKELHEKKFEYFEAVRNPEADPDTLAKLEKDISDLQEKIVEKAPGTAYGKRGGYGRRGGYGCRW